MEVGLGIAVTAVVRVRRESGSRSEGSRPFLLPGIFPFFRSTSEWKLAPGQRLAKASSFGSAARQVRHEADTYLITDMLSLLAPASSSW